MWSIVASLALMTLLPPGTLGLGASEAMQEYLGRHPITTKSAAQSQATAVNMDSLKAAVLAGDYMPKRTLSQRCPASCSSLGLESSAWSAYHSANSLLDRCEETLLLNFALNTTVDGSKDHVTIRGCTGDLASSGITATKTSCPVHHATTNTTTESLELVWNSIIGNATLTGAQAALGQLLAYESVNPSLCNETMEFAYSGKTAVGVYMGSGLHRQDLLAPFLQAMIDRVKTDGITDTLAVQLRGSERSARYIMGIIISSDLADAQDAI